MSGVCGDGCCRRPVLDAELRVDLFEMLVDSAWAETKDLRDITVRLALGEPRKHFALSGGEAEFTSEFSRQSSGGVLGKAQQILVRTVIAHVVQAKLGMIRK